MLVMIEYTFTFKMVNKTKNSGSERVAGLTLPLMWTAIQWITLRSFRTICSLFQFCIKPKTNTKNIKLHSIASSPFWKKKGRGSCQVPDLSHLLGGCFLFGQIMAWFWVIRYITFFTNCSINVFWAYSWIQLYLNYFPI